MFGIRRLLSDRVSFPIFLLSGIVIMKTSASCLPPRLLTGGWGRNVRVPRDDSENHSFGLILTHLYANVPKASAYAFDRGGAVPQILLEAAPVTFNLCVRSLLPDPFNAKLLACSPVDVRITLPSAFTASTLLGFWRCAPCSGTS